MKLVPPQKIFVVFQIGVFHQMQFGLDTPSVEDVVEAATSEQCVSSDEPRKLGVHNHRTRLLQMKSMLVEHPEVKGLAWLFVLSAWPICSFLCCIFGSKRL